MKKILLSAFCAVLSAAATAQNIMVVEQKSGTTTEFSVDDIQRVYFKNDGGTDVNPSNAALSSRLKDKDGNPVLLEGVRASSGEWLIKCEYNNNGDLTNYISDKDTCTVNGFNITSFYERHDDSHDSRHDYEIHLTLNENGLISELTMSYKKLEYGKLYNTMYANFYFIYNQDLQLVEQQIKNYQTVRYNDDGSVKDDNTMDYTYYYNWADGDIENPDYNNISYSTELNITAQNVRTCRYFEGPMEALYMLGLFGIGTAHFPIAHTYTLNPNGTIASEDDVLYIYK